jgi:DNA-binding transcriptional LysR family regulator
MITTTNDSALTAALAGFGITRLLSYQVAEHLRTGTLKTVLTAFESAALPVHVVHREGRQAPQRVRAFLDLAIARLREDSTLH